MSTRAGRRRDRERSRPRAPLHADGLRRRGPAARRARAEPRRGSAAFRPYLLERAKGGAACLVRARREEEVLPAGARLPSRKALKYSTFSRDDGRSAARLSRTFGRNQHSGIELASRHPGARQRSGASSTPCVTRHGAAGREGTASGKPSSRARGSIAIPRFSSSCARATGLTSVCTADSSRPMSTIGGSRAVTGRSAFRWHRRCRSIPAGSIEESIEFVSPGWIAMRVLLANKFLRPGAGAEDRRSSRPGSCRLRAGHEVIDFAMEAGRTSEPAGVYFAPERPTTCMAVRLRNPCSMPARRCTRRRPARDPAARPRQRPDVAHLHNV